MGRGLECFLKAKKVGSISHDMGQDYLSFGEGEARLTKQQMLALGYFAIFRKSLKSLGGYSVPKHELADRLTPDGVLLATIYWSELHGGVCGPFALHGPLKVFFAEERAAFMDWQAEMGYGLSAKKGNRDTPQDYRPAVERWLGGNKSGSPRSLWYKDAIKLGRHRRLLTDVRKKLPERKQPLESQAEEPYEETEVATAPATEDDTHEVACGCIVVLVVIGLLCWRFL